MAGQRKRFALHGVEQQRNGDAAQRVDPRWSGAAVDREVLSSKGTALPGYESHWLCMASSGKAVRWSGAAKPRFEARRNGSALNGTVPLRPATDRQGGATQSAAQQRKSEAPHRVAMEMPSMAQNGYAMELRCSTLTCNGGDWP